MGFPLTSALGDSAPSLTEGIVSKTTGWGDNIGTFSFTSKANKGNSGGPIFTDNGELIGVTVSKLPKKDFLVNSASLKDVRSFSREVFGKLKLHEDLKEELVLAIAEAAQNIPFNQTRLSHKY